MQGVSIKARLNDQGRVEVFLLLGSEGPQILMTDEAGAMAIANTLIWTIQQARQQPGYQPPGPSEVLIADCLNDSMLNFEDATDGHRTTGE